MRGSDGCDPLYNVCAFCAEQRRGLTCALGKRKGVRFPWKKLLQFQHKWPDIRNTDLNLIKSSHCNCSNRNFSKEELPSL